MGRLHTHSKAPRIELPVARFWESCALAPTLTDELDLSFVHLFSVLLQIVTVLRCWENEEKNLPFRTNDSLGIYLL